MATPRKYLERYSDSLNRLCEASRARVYAILDLIDFSQADADQIVRYVMDAAGSTFEASASVAERLSCEFYDGLRAIEGIDDGFKASPVRSYDSGRMAVSVKEAAEKATTTQKLIDGCCDAVDKETRRAANVNTAGNSKKDPRKPKCARVPVGPSTCEWCVMLASLGFYYQSEESASHSHPNCDCRIVPSFNEQREAIEGYDPKYYLDCYENHDKHPEVRDAINARRRELRAERKAQEGGEE